MLDRGIMGEAAPGCNGWSVNPLLLLIFITLFLSIYIFLYVFYFIIYNP